MQHKLFTTAPLVLGLIAGGSLEVQERDSFVGVERVKVRWAAGSIHVGTHHGDAVEIETTTWGPEAPFAYTARRDAEILVLELQCRAPAPCGGELELRLPSHVQLELDLGEGLVQLDGVGESTIIVGTGSIDARALSAKESILQVVDGDIHAEWATVPERVVIATVTGDAELRLPEADYSLEDQLGHSTLVGLRDVEGASSKVQVTTIDGHADIYGVRSLAAL
jgi:hypothetical protein